MDDHLHSDRTARYLKALAAPDRLKIIQCLMSGPKNVSELADLLGSEYVNVSHHLSVLRHTRLVRDQKHGKFVVYSLHPEVLPRRKSVGPSRQLLDLGCCRLEWDVPLADVTPEQRLAYERDGFLVLPGFFPVKRIERAVDEAERLLDRGRHLMSLRNLRCRWQPNIYTGGSEFETFDPVIDLSPACRELANDERLLNVLAGLYGEPACLFKDKLIYKPPGVKGYDLHQDWIGWPGFPRSFLTVVLPLDAACRDNGATEVFAGYHQGGALAPEDGDYHPLPTSLVDESRGVLLELQPGDVAVFSGFTPHRSAPNRSGRWRRHLYLSYNKRSEGGEQRDSHYREFHVWLRRKYAEFGKTDLYFE